MGKAASIFQSSLGKEVQQSRAKAQDQKQQAGRKPAAE
jgi:hypothetical protein